MSATLYKVIIDARRAGSAQKVAFFGDKRVIKMIVNRVFQSAPICVAAAILLALCAISANAQEQEDKRGMAVYAGSEDVDISLDGDDISTSGSSKEESDELLASPPGNSKVTRSAWRVFMVGTNDYEKAPQLQFCVNDVDGLVDRLTSAGVPSGNIVALRSREQLSLQPTKANIEREYQKFVSSLKEGDLVMIYLSGHGIEAVDNKGIKTHYYAPQDANPKQIASTCVSIKQMMSDLDSSPAKTKWMIVDACRESQGKGIVDGRSLMTTVENAPKSIILLQSCESGEISFEDAKEGHGIFTQSLIEALADDDNPADVNHDFTLTFTEMFSYVHNATREKAKALSRPIQTPYLSGDFTDFALTTGLTQLGCSKSVWAEAEKHYKDANSLKTKDLESAIIESKLACKLVPGYEKFQDLYETLVDGNDGGSAASRLKKAREYYNQALNFWYGVNDVKVNERQAYNLISSAEEYGLKEARGFLSFIEYTGSSGREPDREKTYIYASSASVQSSSDIAVWALGECYRQGIGVAKNISKSDALFKEAFERLSKASEGGDLIAATQLGMLYYEGTGVERSYEKAVECWQKASNGGVARAMDALGMCYRNGHGVAKDEEQAREWFEKATEHDYPNALVSLGECYQEGIGVDQDLEEARRLYQRAADAKSGEGMNALGYYYLLKGDEDEMRRWYEKGAELGAPSAMNNLGVYYEQKGKPKDAVRYYEKAVDLGYTKAMVNLGNYYYNHEGNLAEAQKWYQKAANLGNSSEAMLYLGNALIENGKYEESAQWYEKAGKLKNGEALYQLAELHYAGVIDGAKDYVRAGKLFKQSGDLGYRYSYYRAGELLAAGQGTKDGKRNLKLAFTYYMKAANCDAPVPEACQKVAECYQKGLGVEKDAKQAQYWNNVYRNLRR